MIRIYIRRVRLSDMSFFWRGECNGCDWISESLCNPELHTHAQIHLRVFHNGGMICHPGQQEIEVKAK
jgi:hypothetical protein